MKQPWNRKLETVLPARKWLAGASFALLCAPPSAFARVDVRVEIGVPPPVAVVDVTPAPRHGYVYAPGYWAWHGDRHVWIGGRYVLERPGHYWVSERWEPAGPKWRFVDGHWAPHKHKHKHKHKHHRDD